MRKIPIESWIRKKQFLFFKDYDIPFFNITANVDVTELITYCKRTKTSFFKCCLFLATKAANEIEEFRSRITGEEVVIYEEIHVGTTILNKDETFSFCYFNFAPNYENFADNATKAIDKLEKVEQTNDAKLDEKANSDNLIRFSAIPWVSFTSFSNARRLNINDSIPIVVFGKYFENSQKIQMPLSVEVHHALMDGIHVGKYFQLFQSYIDEPTKHICSSENGENI